MYRNLKVSKKLLLGFGMVILIAAIMMAVSIASLVQVGGLSHKLYVGPYVSSTESMGIRRDLNAMGKDIRSAYIEKDIAKYETNLNETIKSLNERIDKIHVSFSGDKKYIQDVETTLADLTAQREKVISLMKNGDWDTARTSILTTYYAAFQKCADSANALYNDADVRAANFDHSNTQTKNLAFAILVIAFIVMLVCAVIITVITTGAIVRPISEIERVASEMADGHLNVTVSYQSRDELGILSGQIRHLAETLQTIISDEDYLLGEMAKGNFDLEMKLDERYVGDFQSILLSMQRINQRLSDTLFQINISADQVSSGSDQVSTSAQALSQGATEQASAVEQLAATIAEISEQIKNNADNAQEASVKATQTGNQMLESKQQMQAMTTAMNDISYSSQEIGKIIKTIEDIAFQTNILALNAAVEAARAGAAGKGFAVVADEVRNLAGKSAEASKNTTVLIESSLRAVENGTKIADETAQSLITAVEGSKIVTEIINSISNASSQQATSITQITQGIDQISSVVQTNSATAEESAAASEELSGQAQMLKDYVSQFKLKNTETPSVNASKEYNMEIPCETHAYMPLNSMAGKY